MPDDCIIRYNPLQGRISSVVGFKGKSCYRKIDIDYSADLIYFFNGIFLFLSSAGDRTFEFYPGSL